MKDTTDVQRNSTHNIDLLDRRSAWLRVLVCIVAVAGIIVAGTALLSAFSVAQASEPVDVGYRDFSYGQPNGTCSSNPTAEKPESKLWFADGSWWGSLCDDQAGDYFIYRLDLVTQSWQKTGTVLDTRPTSRADTLWDGNKLYMVSHLVTEGGAPAANDGDRGRLYRYSYDAGTDTYTPDDLGAVSGKDFAYVNDAESETLTLAKDSTDQLWVTYTMSDSVYVNRSMGGDDGTWGDPFIISDTTNVISATNLTTDDISSIIAFEDKSTGNGYIGVMWSNQNDNAFYFAVHPDTAADTASWTIVSAYAGSQVAEDHINLKSLHADDAGNVFAVVKTSTSTPLIVLLSCNASSSCTTSSNWSADEVYHKSGGLDPTRPILLIDETNRDLYVFVTTPEIGGAIYYKTSSIDSIDFGDPDAFGTPFIRSAQDAEINNATSTKQNLTEASGLVVLASDSTTKYYLHNYLCLDSTGATCPKPEVQFDPTIYSVNEAGGSATMTVTLSSRSANAVMVDYAASGGTATSGTDYTANGTLTFAAGTVSQTINVPITDDDIDESDETATLTLSNPVNATLGTDINATLTITDNDTAGVTVAPTTLSVVEAGATDTYSVTLTSEPTDTVSVSVTAGSEVTVDTSTLTFTPGNWDTPQSVTVTAVDDDLVEGPHADTISHTVASADPAYDGITAGDVTANITDNDSAGVTVAPTTLSVVEAGATDTYSVTLTSKPTDTVSVSVTAGSQVTVDATTLTFTPANWDTPQSVTVTAVDDDLVEGPHADTISHTVASADPAYDSIAAGDVTANITDNDSAGVAVTPANVNVAEGGVTDSYDVTLTSEPTDTVTVSVTAGSQVTVDTSTLTFTPANWDTPQSVTVTAVDDDLVEGPHADTISHTVASADPAYDGIAADDVNVTIADNDYAIYLPLTVNMP